MRSMAEGGVCIDAPSAAFGGTSPVPLRFTGEERRGCGVGRKATAYSA